MTPSAEHRPSAGRRASAERRPGPAGHGGRRPPNGTASSATGAWLELSVVTDGEAVEVVSEILGRVAPGGTSIEPGFELIDEGLAAQPDPTRPVTVRAYVPARDGAAAARATREVDRALGHLRAFDLRPIGELATRLVDEADWADAWKRYVPVLRIGRRIVIRPTWRRHRRADGDVVLALDPGMAFGTGLHPTTRLCLVALEHAADRGVVLGRAGARVLDVGCGSGILAIAAARLGAGEVLGLDTDSIAVDATRANARRNGVARRVRARLGSLPSGDGPHDLVLANLVASLLVRLASELAAEVRPGGGLIASGIFVDREAEVRDAFAAADLEVTERLVEGDWVALEATRRA